MVCDEAMVGGGGMEVVQRTENDSDIDSGRILG